MVKGSKAVKHNDKSNNHPHSSDSDNSDGEDNVSHHSSSSSVVEEIVNGNTRKTIKTTTRTTRSRKISTGSGSDSDSSDLSDTPSIGFISRVISIPIVQDGVKYAKENKYGKIALDTAGNAVDTVNKLTQPVQKRLQPTISKVDQIANSTFDKLENQFPIITKPTSEIYSQVKKPITQVTSTIDSKVATPARQYTNSITTTATSARDRVTTQLNERYTTVTSTASSAADQIATRLDGQLSPLVDGLESIANRYLPGDETVTDKNKNQAARVMELTRSVSSRVSARLGGPQSAEELRQLAGSNPVVNKSKESIEVVSQKLTALLDTLNAQTKELQGVPKNLTIQAQATISSLNETLLKQADSLYVYLKDTSSNLPESVQERLLPVYNYLNDRYVVIKVELAKSDLTALQKIRNILQVTTEQTIPILRSAAEDIKVLLVSYQIKVQENLQRGIDKAFEVQSTIQRNVAEYSQNARFVVTGHK